MIKYFKELENPSSHYLVLIDNRDRSVRLEVKNIPLDFFAKHKKIFARIEELDLLHEKKDKQFKLYNNRPQHILNDLDELVINDFPLEFIYDYDICNNKHIFFQDGNEEFTNHALIKIFELRNEYLKLYQGTDFDKDFFKYFLVIVEMFTYKDELLKGDKTSIYNYLKCAKIILKFQNRLTNEDELLFNNALDDLSKLKTKIESKPIPIDYYLPNEWFITPFGHLYNSMGPYSHKEANLWYPLYYSIYRDDTIEDFSCYLKSLNYYLEKGYTSVTDYNHYLNTRYDFPCIYEDEYYDLKPNEKLSYNLFEKKSYNPTLLKLMVGFKSAHAGLFAFFDDLKKNSSDYYEDLELLKKMDIDEILVRCCRFHKVSSVREKTITTSCINYEEEFVEYINRGWTIDFVKPIVLSPESKRLEEYNDDFILIRQLLKK